MNQTIDPRTEREEWLAQRRNYLGATDAASILGKGFSTQLGVYNEKKGIPNPEPDEDARFRMDVGLALEPVLGQYFTLETGMALMRVPTLFHPDYPHIGANLDFLSEDGKAVIETKTYGIGRHHEFGDEGTDDVPDGYHIQLTIQMGLAILNGYPVQGGFLYACSMGTQTRKIWAIPFDRDFFELLVKKLDEFWHDHILPSVPPAVVAKDEDRLRLMYPEDDGNFMLSTPQDDDLVGAMLRVNRDRKAACEKFDNLKAELINRIGSASGMDTIHGRVSYKAGSGKNVTDWESVAKGLADEIPVQLIAANTERKPGARRLLLPREAA